MTAENFERIADARFYHDLVQGTDEWRKMRLGLITASGMHNLLTPTLKGAKNASTRLYIYELLAERITQFVEPGYQSWDMERGHFDEEFARDAYHEHVAQVDKCGFIVRDDLNFDVGYSPDGLVGDDGLIEVKGRVPKHQIKTIIEHVADPHLAKSVIPAENVIQVQTALWVAEREWCDYVSYGNGLNIAVIRVYPDPRYQDAIAEALIETEMVLGAMMAQYRGTLADGRIYPVERHDYIREMEIQT